LATDVETRLRRKVFVAPPQAELFLEGTTVLQSSQGEVRLALYDANERQIGLRTLSATNVSCDDMHASLVLAISLLIDPNATLLASPEPSPPPAQSASASLAAPAPGILQPCRPEVTPPPPVASRWHGAVAIGPAVSVGLVPGFIAPGVAVSSLLEAPWFSWPIEANASFWPPHNVVREAGVGRLSLTQAGLALCPLNAFSSGSPWRLLGCAGAQAGAFLGEGQGFDVVKQQQRFVVQGELHGRAVVSLGGLFNLPGGWEWQCLLFATSLPIAMPTKPPNRFFKSPR